MLDQRNSTSSKPRDSKVWRKIWGLNVAPKIRNFLWKASKNINPTGENLVRRHHGRVSICQRCREEVETMEHILFFCPFAQATWKVSSFNYSPRKEGFTSFLQWWIQVFNTFVEAGSFSAIGLASYLCWHIWKPRNSFLFEGQSDDPTQVWNLALQEFLEFTGAIAEHASHGSEWRGWVAAVCRDHNGNIVDGCSCIVFANSVDVAEALAVKMACNIAWHRDWNNIIVESNNKALVERLINPNQNSRWDAQAVEASIRSIICNLSQVSCAYVHRSANVVADWVEKKLEPKLALLIGCATLHLSWKGFL
ncbi:hypothetical protein COLO4_10073 [Corchorus olitorius]|uniref:Reverse transcriptase zinc-binding domain-containing protein n=1 Tax=Corchorus olitorius TaxID=93759 RepID=A0A1R3KA43_9ROSI|nr:hypothetical protein COLO4_10073 [Corchorus olitorius]